MKKKKIGIFFVGGKISSFKDKKLNAEFPFQKTSEVLEVIPEIAEFADITLFPAPFEKRFFLELPEWSAIFEQIKKNSKIFDGFVIAQESDSLIFGANVLAFMCSQFRKPIVFTASPLSHDFHRRGLAQENLKGAILAATEDVGEVAIFSHGKLLRAVRTKQRSISSSHPFFSSVVDDLGRMEKNTLCLALHRIRRDPEMISFPFAFPKQSVFFLRLFPGFPIEYLQGIEKHKFDALIVESLGYGSVKPSLFEHFEKLNKAGTSIIIVAEHDVPQRNFPMDADTQFLGTSFLVIRNMPILTTITKVNFLIRNFKKTDLQAKMQENFCGEILEEVF